MNEKEKSTESNPVQALDAILEVPYEVDGLTVRPLTLGRYALLELLKSPFVFPDREFTLAEIIPSAYVMTQDFKDVAGYDSSNIGELRKKAMEWADDGDFRNFDKVIQAIVRRMQKVDDAAPHGTMASGDGSVEGEKKTPSPTDS